MNKFLILIFCTFFFYSCAITIPPKKHVIAIDKKGFPVNPESQTVFNDEDYQKHINNVLTTSKDKIIIYIHGGLNTPNSTNKRVVELSKSMLNQKYHPIFINWRSGFFTTYGDHLLNQRQGENWPKAGLVTFPFILVSDLARGVSRIPMNWWHQIGSYIKGVSFNACSTHSPNERNAVKLNCKYISTHQFGEITKITDQYDTRSVYRKAGDTVLGGVELLSGLVTAPLFDAAGTGSWDVMKQRTEVMFSKEKPYGATGYDDINSYTNTRIGALSTFLKSLKNVKNKEIILIGHSMGTIVANKILIQHPNINFSRIIYMAAACSIKDFQTSVIPYLKGHKNTQFYNYTLHPVAENLESHGSGFGGTGSLLNQIDNFYENPVFENQRTLGKWINVMNGINFLNVDNVQSQMFLRTMKLDKAYPTTHGAFDDPNFLVPDKEFWTEHFGKQ